MTIYFLSGLGADYRAFQFLTFAPDVKAVFIEWIKPEKNEPLKSYAKRIAATIDTSSPFVLVGLSFGGILATEVIEFITPKKQFLYPVHPAGRSFLFITNLLGFYGLINYCRKRAYINAIFPPTGSLAFQRQGINYCSMKYC